MAITPIVVDLSSPASAASTTGSNGSVSRANGERVFAYNGAYYMAGCQNSSTVIVRKSTDLKTWTTLDQSNQPILSGNPLISYEVNSAAMWGDRICIGMDKLVITLGPFGANTVDFYASFVTFNLTTETWAAGIPTTSTSWANTGSRMQVMAIPRADGSVVVTHHYNNPVGTASHCNIAYSVYNGTWIIDNIKIAEFSGSLELQSRRSYPVYDGEYVHFLYNKGERYDGTWELLHRSLSNGNSLSSETTAYTQPGAFPDPDKVNGNAPCSFMQVPVYCPSSGKIVVPIAEYQGDFFNTGDTLWLPVAVIGSAGSSSPAWSRELIASSSENTSEMGAAEKTDGQIVMVWRAKNTHATVANALRYSERSSGAAWSAAQTFYDIDADPQFSPGQWSTKYSSPFTVIGHWSWLVHSFTSNELGLGFGVVAEAQKDPVFSGTNYSSWSFYDNNPCCCTDGAFLP